ncbi:MAG: response regulator [Candidatus Manganitrophus sp.]|nr:MAG: response regulator [Candidatus Manganitrophus sp.]
MPDPNMKILVVDDMSSMRRIIKNTLKQLGYPNTDEAEDGDKALEMVRNTPFDLVVSDWNMPNMNGLDLLKAIRQDPKIIGAAGLDGDDRSRNGSYPGGDPIGGEQLYPQAVHSRDDERKNRQGL